MPTTDELVDAKLDEMLGDMDEGPAATPGVSEDRSAQEVAAAVENKPEKSEKREYEPRKEAKVLGKVDLKGPGRGPDGKFVAKEAPAETPQASGLSPESTPEAPKPQTPTIVPASLSPELRDEFRKLPPEAQQIAARHLKAAEGNLYQKAERFARDMSFAQAVEREAMPYEEEIRRSGKHPLQVYPQMLAWHRALERDPQEALNQLAQIYGKKAPQMREPMAQAPGAEPDSMLLSRLEQLENSIKFAQVQSHIDAWKGEKDGEGNPAYPFADQLEDEMAPIVAGLRQTMPNEPHSKVLTRAYRLVIAEHPEIQESLTQKAEARAKATALKNGTAEAQKMRKAAVSPKGSSNGAPARVYPKSTEDIVGGLMDGTIEPI